MESKDIAKVTADIKKKYPEMGLDRIEWNGTTASIFVKPEVKALAGLEAKNAIKLRTVERAATLRRQTLDRTGLDLSQTYNTPYNDTPQSLFLS